MMASSCGRLQAVAVVLQCLWIVSQAAASAGPLSNGSGSLPVRLIPTCEAAGTTTAPKASPVAAAESKAPYALLGIIPAVVVILAIASAVSAAGDPPEGPPGGEYKLTEIRPMKLKLQ